MTGLLRFSSKAHARPIQVTVRERHILKPAHRIMARIVVYSHEVKAPTLLLLATTGDYRVPITQSYRFYHALRDNGVTTKFIGYPMGGHSPTDPVHQRDVLRRYVEWLKTYLDGSGATVSSGQ